MSNLSKLTSLIFILCTFLAGCGTTGLSIFTKPTPQRIKEEQNDISAPDITGSSPVLPAYKIAPINLLFMLDPDGNAKDAYNKIKDKSPASSREWKELNLDEQYQIGFTVFYNGNGDLRLARNRIQDRIKQSSDLRCESYKRFLFVTQANTNFWTGLGSTVSGVLGPLFGERGAKNLAVTSGIFGGYRAEANQDYFYNLTATVITSGITQAQIQIYSKIQSSRNLSIQDYGIEKAIGDMVVYDNSCSAIAGMQQAQNAIHTVSDPGLDAANRILMKANTTSQVLANLNNSSPEKIADLNKSIEASLNSPLLTSGQLVTVGASNGSQAASSAIPKLVFNNIIDSQIPNSEFNSDAEIIANLYFSGKNSQALPQVIHDVSDRLINTVYKPLIDLNVQYSDLVNNCSNTLAIMSIEFAKNRIKLADKNTPQFQIDSLNSDQNLLMQKSENIGSKLTRIVNRIKIARSNYISYFSSKVKPETAPNIDTNSLPDIDKVDKEWDSDLKILKDIVKNIGCTSP